MDNAAEIYHKTDFSTKMYITNVLSSHSHTYDLPGLMARHVEQYHERQKKALPQGARGREHFMNHATLVNHHYQRYVAASSDKTQDFHYNKILEHLKPI